MAFFTRALALLPLTLAIAGCAGDPDDRDPAPVLDTGMIEPGAQKSLTFTMERPYRLHCAPHPFMKHNVTVQPGSALAAHVHILDGNGTQEFRFDPSDATVGRGAVVSYHNHGSLAHTATELAGTEHGGH